MSVHIEAGEGAVAPKVLLPGDPLRARSVAENFLEDARCYSRVRGMFGYTGFYESAQGRKRVSVQGTGMGMPSLSIYVNELLRFYGAETLIRIGTCGALQKDLKLRDTLAVISASTDSAVNRTRFGRVQYAPTADFDLLQKAREEAGARGIPLRVGPVLTTDLFYNKRSEELRALLAGYGVQAVEMETAELYTLAAEFGKKALALLTVSDAPATGEETSAREREQSFTAMVKIALEII